MAERARAAIFVRYVSATETGPDLAQACKVSTWNTECEHAVLRLADDRRVLVCGGPYGINLELSTGNDPFGREAGTLWVIIAGAAHRIVALELHTHPRATGPSADDERILSLLRQDASLLVEIGSPYVDGQWFGPKGWVDP